MDALMLAASAARLLRATVHDVREDGVLEVIVDGTACVCDCLDSVQPSAIRSGDEVIVCQPEGAERAVVLGRIGTRVPHSASEPEAQSTPRNAADELVIEARKNLTLKCGEGSITIREDGKILIKGRDLVSHAKRMNRIRGGSVAIN
jgi:hypothetical protein